jgi:hypothetical protein
MNLTTRQQDIFNTARAAWLGNGARIHLDGAAGCGKSVLLGSLIQSALADLGKRAVLVVTPTHEAANVLRARLGELGVETNYTDARGRKVELVRTLASVLMRRPDDEEEPDAALTTKFKKGDSPATWGGITALFVDEGSMISKEDIGELLEAFDDTKCVIVAGDSQQLPPVEGKPFLANAATLGFVRHGLTEILRQASDTEIAQFSHDVYAADGDLRPVRAYAGVTVYTDRKEWGRRLCAAVAAGLDVRAVAFRNATVAKLTQHIRTHMNRSLLWAEVDDKLRIESTVTVWNGRSAETILTNGEVVRVRERSAPRDYTLPLSGATVPVQDVVVDDGSTLHRITVSGFDKEELAVAFEAQRRAVINVWGMLKKEDAASFEASVENLLIDALDYTGRRRLVERYSQAGVAKARGYLWARLFFAERSRIVMVSDSVAGTAHKAQGRSLDEVFIDGDDMLTAPSNARELAYVGVSRARKHVHILLRGR